MLTANNFLSQIITLGFGLQIYGLFGYLVNFWVVPISLSLVKFSDIRSNSGQFWLYGQLLVGHNVEHISGTKCTEERRSAGYKHADDERTTGWPCQVSEITRYKDMTNK